MNRAIFSYLLLLVTLSSGASIAADQLTTQFKSCMDKSGGITAAMLNCISAETRIHDARLNVAYKVLQNDLSPKRKSELQLIQRQWIRYRDDNCRFYADPEGGTAVIIAGANCIMHHTMTRATELENLKP